MRKKNGFGGEEEERDARLLAQAVKRFEEKFVTLFVDCNLDAGSSCTLKCW